MVVILSLLILSVILEQYVPIEVFKNTREDSIIEIVGYLDSQGIDAIYVSSPAPYAFLETCTLSVNKDQVEEAKKALQIFQDQKKG
jgi:hypothetical protein